MTARGYGFITPKSGQDLLVHFRSIQAQGIQSASSKASK